MGKKKRKDRAWQDVTPQEPSSVLVGGGQGGFVSLEEIDEDLVFGAIDAYKISNAQAEEGAGNKSGKKKRKRSGEIGDLNSVEEAAEAALEKPKKKKAKKKQRKPKPSEEARTASGEEKQITEITTKNVEETEETVTDLPEWNDLRLHPALLKALSVLGFNHPTPIQRACIPAAAHKGKDVIGAAETGSGKTLAFGIPILQRLLDERDKLLCQNVEATAGGALRALIVTPTRELALQICDHLRTVAKFTDFRVVPIVGGMSTEKQQRLLKQQPAIVVGTPGRLWELMSTGENHLVELQELSFFILDEADRMVEKGHFQELQSIIGLLPTTEKLNESQAQDSELAQTIVVSAKKRRQTLVFSATLTLPEDFKKKLKKGRGVVKASNQYSVAVLSERAGIGQNTEIVDLTSKNIVAEKLSESAIECREEEKDVFLYYVLKVHGGGRAIVFCTSIAALRRLSTILRLLEIPAWPLHAQLQQRQRLKTMDKFRSQKDGVLIATDVAARGLDIPGVRTVIHYQLPHSAEMYVHRSGRTARAECDGCSIALISPSEKPKYLTLCRALSKSSGLTSFPINPAYIPSIQKRVALAVKIDKLLRCGSQEKANKTWFERHAKELEIDLDTKEDDNEDQKARNSSQLRSLQEELKHMVKQPLEIRGFSRRYVAGTGLTPLAAQHLKDYVAKPGHGRVVVIGQEEMEPLQALKRLRSN